MTHQEHAPEQVRPKRLHHGCTTGMCALYSLARSRDEVNRWFCVNRDLSDNPPLPSIFPDQLAPVIRLDTDGARVMQPMRWGFPPPPNVGTRPVTNVRNTSSSIWRNWLKPQFRCLVPAANFCEYTDSQPKMAHWFALGTDRQPFAFAGIGRPWAGTRKGESGEHMLFALITTDANPLREPIHAKAMPVVVTGNDADTSLSAPVEVALQLQHPAPQGLLSIVATGVRKDALADSPAG